MAANPGTTSEITQSPTLVFPVDGEGSGSFTSAELRWNAVEGANKYLVQLSRTPAFTGLQTITLVADETTLLVEDLLEDISYFWRVRPYNEYSTCRGFSAIGTFKTNETVSVNTISFVNSWSVSPNPVSKQQMLELRLESDNNFTGQVRLLDYNGRELLRRESVDLKTGSNSIQIEVNKIPPGLYIIQLNSPFGSLADKVVVLN